MHEYFAPGPLHQRPQAFSHPPAYIAEYLQPVMARNQKSDAAVAQHADCLGKALERLQIEAGKVKLLKLFFRKHSVFSSQHAPDRGNRRDCQKIQIELCRIQQPWFSILILGILAISTSGAECSVLNADCFLNATSCIVPGPHHSGPPAISAIPLKKHGRRWNWPSWMSSELLLRRKLGNPGAERWPARPMAANPC